MKDTIRYLFSDMDGTLIGSDHAVSAENAAAIRTFVSRGGHFSVATGRSPEIALPFLHGIPLNAPAILYNGAAVYDFEAGAFLHKQLLSETLTMTPKCCAMRDLAPHRPTPRRQLQRLPTCIWARMTNMPLHSSSAPICCRTDGEIPACSAFPVRHHVHSAAAGRLCGEALPHPDCLSFQKQRKTGKKSSQGKTLFLPQHSRSSLPDGSHRQSAGFVSRCG